MNSTLRVIPDSKIIYFRRKIKRWGKNNYSDFPWRKTNNRWHALTVEIMLQRTRAEQVSPAYRSFIRKYKTPSDYLSDKHAMVFESLGLRWRDKELKKLATVLSERAIPAEKENLLKLPGVGDYISSAYRSLHLDIRDVIIDSNIVRLYGRFFGFITDGETRRKKWLAELSDKITPRRAFRAFNYGLIDFTRAICKPKPLCAMCVIRHKCNHYTDSKKQR